MGGDWDGLSATGSSWRQGYSFASQTCRVGPTHARPDRDASGRSIGNFVQRCTSVLSFASESHCDGPARLSSADAKRLRNFTAQFDLKYRVPQPLYRPWYSPTHMAVVAAKRVSLDTYYIFFLRTTDWLDEHQEAMQDAREEVDFPTVELVNEMRANVLPSLRYAVKEWLIEGIRISYSKHVFHNWNARAAWKILKHGASSGARKLAKYGIFGTLSALWCVLRGDVVHYIADLTYHVAAAALFTSMQRQRRSPGRVLRHMLVEALTSASRLLLNGLGAGVATCVSYFLYWLVGGSVSYERFAHDKDGRPKPLPFLMVLSVASVISLTDIRVTVDIKPWLEKQLL